MAEVNRVQDHVNQTLTARSITPAFPRLASRATRIQRSHQPAQAELQKTLTSRALRLAPRGVIDLRRHTGLDTAKLLCERARHLERAERVLVESVFRDGHSLFQIARLHAAASEPGGAQETPEALRIIARRLGRSLKLVIRRMTSPLFVFVASRVERSGLIGDSPAWPAERRRVGELVVLHGHTLTHAARELKIPFHSARAHLRAIEAMYAGAAS